MGVVLINNDASLLYVKANPNVQGTDRQRAAHINASLGDNEIRPIRGDDLLVNNNGGTELAVCSATLRPKRSLISNNEYKDNGQLHKKIRLLPYELNGIPDEIVQKISNYLDIQSIANMLVTNKSMSSRRFLKVRLLLCNTY